jgi:hypothetical protein
MCGPVVVRCRPSSSTCATARKPKDRDRLASYSYKGVMTLHDEKDSQQEPRHDSGLQTPQPDQPMPTEQERRDEDTTVTRTTETTEVVEETSSDT